MNDRLLDTVVTLCIIALVLGILGGVVGLSNWVAYRSCEAQTQSIGFAHRYSFFGGCQIEVKPGQWIPLDNYYFKQQ